MSRCIAIANQKGGVAKTTTCLSLGASLVEMGKTVLMIDLDPQASLTWSMGIDPRRLRRSVADAVLHNTTLICVSQETSVPGLEIAPASAGLATIDKVLYREPGYEMYLKDMLSELDESFYDYILIDCAPSLGPLVLNALTACELLIVPIQAEFYAIKSLDNVFQLIELIRSRTNPNLRYRLLVTMYDRRNSVCVRVLEQMRDHFAHALFGTVIQIDTKLRESPMLAMPITHYDPTTRGASQYRALAEEVVRDE